MLRVETMNYWKNQRIYNRNIRSLIQRQTDGVLNVIKQIMYEWGLELSYKALMILIEQLLGWEGRDYTKEL